MRKKQYESTATPIITNKSRHKKIQNPSNGEKVKGK